MVAPTMMVVGVMMAPRGVMPIVDAMVMREGMSTVPMARVRGRVVRVCVFCMTMMAVSAMAVRMMVSSVPVPAMAPLGKQRLTTGQHASNHDDETKHMKRSHESGPLI
jgi:hypothetical protein